MSNAADVTDAQWKETVLDSETPVLVDFWAEWCQPCKAMSEPIDRLAEQFGERLRVVKINIDENPKTPAEYGVMSIPTFLVVKGGKEVGLTRGVQPYDKLVELVEQHL